MGLLGEDEAHQTKLLLLWRSSENIMADARGCRRECALCTIRQARELKDPLKIINRQMKKEKGTCSGARHPSGSDGPVVMDALQLTSLCWDDIRWTIPIQN
ncbi:hypothetical protein OUZ56_029053 [Daphnia magna]|uniref:Uncharacterized protein n=1 Tax=Daphnia magna TaxID=35525 RepID=A0ABR0B5P7_9CRUS|nr:hypothetical protein OUZ56_029053 [Daphnia magna]